MFGHRAWRQWRVRSGIPSGRSRTRGHPAAGRSSDQLNPEPLLPPRAPLPSSRPSPVQTGRVPPRCGSARMRRRGPLPDSSPQPGSIGRHFRRSSPFRCRTGMPASTDRKLPRTVSTLPRPSPRPGGDCPCLIRSLRRKPELATATPDIGPVSPKEAPFPTPDAACLVGLLNQRNLPAPSSAEPRATGSRGGLAAAVTPRPHRDTVLLVQSGRAHRSIPTLRGVRRRRCRLFRTHVLPSPPPPSLSQSRPRHLQRRLSRAKRWHWQRPEIEYRREYPATSGHHGRKVTPSIE